MNVYETLSLALTLEVNLDIDAEALAIKATPKKHLTSEFREAIAENRDELIRHLLFRRWVLWLTKRVEYEVLSPVLDRTYDELNEAWLTTSLEEFRDLLRRIAREATRKEAA